MVTPRIEPRGGTGRVKPTPRIRGEMPIVRSVFAPLLRDAFDQREQLDLVWCPALRPQVGPGSGRRQEAILVLPRHRRPPCAEPRSQLSQRLGIQIYEGRSWKRSQSGCMMTHRNKPNHERKNKFDCQGRRARDSHGKKKAAFCVLQQHWNRERHVRAEHLRIETCSMGASFDAPP